jgi:hypothetical protein
MAQQPSDNLAPPGVTIGQSGWDKSAASVDGIPPTMISTQTIDRQTALEPGATKLPTGEHPGSSSGSSKPPTEGHRQLYVYSLEIYNQGPKAIRAITWDYIFHEPTSKQELGRITLGNFEKVAANSKKLLQVRSTSSPPRVVTTTGLAKDVRSPFDERVAIKCVLYKDGTVWEHPKEKGIACEEPRQWLIRRGKLKA